MTFKNNLGEPGIYIAEYAVNYVSGLWRTAVRWNGDHIEIIGDDRFYWPEELDKMWALINITYVGATNES